MFCACPRIVTRQLQRAIDQGFHCDRCHKRLDPTTDREQPLDSTPSGGQPTEEPELTFPPLGPFRPISPAHFDRERQAEANTPPPNRLLPISLNSSPRRSPSIAQSEELRYPDEFELEAPEDAAEESSRHNEIESNIFDLLDEEEIISIDSSSESSSYVSLNRSRSHSRPSIRESTTIQTAAEETGPQNSLENQTRSPQDRRASPPVNYDQEPSRFVTVRPQTHKVHTPPTQSHKQTNTQGIPRTESPQFTPLISRTNHTGPNPQKINAATDTPRNILTRTNLLDNFSSDTSAQHPSRQTMELDRAHKFKEIFSGTKNQNVEAFFDRFDRWCENQGHDDRYKIRNFVLCLDGVAFTSYKNLPQETKDDYDALRAVMISHYAPTRLPVDEQYQQLKDMKMKKTDTVQSFYNLILQKSEHLDMSQEQKRVIFKSGLPKYILRYLKTEKPTTLEETLTKAKEAEELGPEYDQNVETSRLETLVQTLLSKLGPTKAPVAALTQTVESKKCEYCLSPLHALRDCQAMHQKLAATAQTGEQEQKCAYCQSTQHIRKNCPTFHQPITAAADIQPPPTRQTPGLVCHFCNEQNHVMADCHRFRQQFGGAMNGQNNSLAHSNPEFAHVNGSNNEDQMHNWPPINVTTLPDRNLQNPFLTLDTPHSQPPAGMTPLST